MILNFSFSNVRSWWYLGIYIAVFLKVRVNVDRVDRKKNQLNQRTYTFGTGLRDLCVVILFADLVCSVLNIRAFMS